MVLKSCEVILNYACNARCLFCYHPDELSRAGAREMPFEKAARNLLAGRKAGCWIAYLIGGEITLREDLPKIIALARKLGYPCIQVMSNGLRLADPGYARSLVRSGANLFRLSVHGSTEEVHDRLVGVPGAFQKVRKAVENLRALGADVAVNHAINALNYRLLPEFVRVCLEGLGVTEMNLIYSHYRGAMAVNEDLLKVRVSEVAPHVLEAMEFLRERGTPVEAPMLVNFTPCILPGCEQLMAEWERPAREEDDDLLCHPEGFSEGIYAMKERERTKPVSCRQCVYDARCLGFEVEYARLYGVGEFRPLPEVPRPFPVSPSFHRALRMCHAA